MDHDQVREFEEEIGKAIARVLRRLSKDRTMPRPPSDRTCHLMAKAAVAVFEAVDEEHAEAKR